MGAGRGGAGALLTSAEMTGFGLLPIFALTDQAGRLFEPLALTKSLAIGGAVRFGPLPVPCVVPPALLCLIPPCPRRRQFSLRSVCVHCS